MSPRKPWVTAELKTLDRQRKREYSKNKKSNKWTNLNLLYKRKCKAAKENYYKNTVEDLKTSKPGQWYSKLKKMSSHDQMKNQEPIVQAQLQAEKIADQFATVSQIYEPLKSSDILFDGLVTQPPPTIIPQNVYKTIKSINNKKASTVAGDVPMQIICECAEELSYPLSNIINRSFTHGEYPDLWKIEIVTPVPKVFPPKNPSQLRKIAGTKNLSLIHI